MLVTVESLPRVEADARVNLEEISKPRVCANGDTSGADQAHDATPADERSVRKHRRAGAGRSAPCRRPSIGICICSAGLARSRPA